MENDQEIKRIRKEQAQRLRHARENAVRPDGGLGWREGAEAARWMGVPVPTYHAHENGERGIVRNAQLYADRFGVSARWLLYGGEEEQPKPPPVFTSIDCIG